MRTKHLKTVKQVNVHIMYIMSLLGIVGLISIINLVSLNNINSASALTYQTKIDNSFRIERSVNVTLSSSDLVINDLAPGSVGSSNATTLAISTNNPTGYTVTSTVGDGDTYTDTDLKHKDSTVENIVDSFTSLATTDLISNIDDIEPGTWGYSFAVDNGSWSSYSGYGTGSTVELVSVDHNVSSTIDFKIAASAKDTQAAGEYNNIINFITTVSPLPYMQDLNSTTIAALLPETHSTATVYDARDDQAYTIAKLKDGKYWMTTNLNLAGGTALYSSTSDVPSGYDENPYYTLPTSSTSGFSSDTDAYVYNSGTTTNCGTSEQNKPCYSYYSWIAATAGSGSNITSVGVDAPYDICPSNWRLPTSGNHEDTDANSSTGYKRGDFYQLASAYGVDLTGSRLVGGSIFHVSLGPNTTANFLEAGQYSGSDFRYGDRGLYWSSTCGTSNDRAYGAGFNVNYYDAANNNQRKIGISVRCLAR